MIKIKEIEIPLPKWWQVGLIIIAMIVAIIVCRENPETAIKILESAMKKLS